MDGETYIRRRHWSAQEKRSVVTEALTSGNVVGTAKRHGIQAQQIYRWRDRLEARPASAVFLPVSLAPEPARPGPAPVLDEASGDRDPAPQPDRSPRMEIVLSAGRRIIVDERTARLIDQIELALEELEATATEDRSPARSAGRMPAAASSSWLIWPPAPGVDPARRRSRRSPWRR